MMIDLLQIAAFNATYAQTIDSDALEQWPTFFTADCRYRVTNIENEAAGLPAGLIWVDSRDMLYDRITAMREANVYEQQRYRHLVGLPIVKSADRANAVAETPFLVVRTMHTGETTVFATGTYRDRFVVEDSKLLLAERVVACDSSVTDTLLVIPF
ncbi:MAG: aromatic-ring-hydroxylating dioxygenase subunit beta [Rhodocyclaceae bacterium]|jgi:anthranilate 1,2-dioxygenase small subunit/terephthalate 1,2-dioxygenase oxygenase component beta subunit|nr:aromatic-ring-hydroxylating dioxygenase subunit beta [Rhodocyclaceae bacterium]HRN77520.1 aromatic-ring-hydroxylating dioxygenase subunit beta [Ottowia sp.]